jgi:hypothetical protein
VTPHLRPLCRCARVLPHRRCARAYPLHPHAPFLCACSAVPVRLRRPIPSAVAAIVWRISRWTSRSWPRSHGKLGSSRGWFAPPQLPAGFSGYHRFASNLPISALAHAVQRVAAVASGEAAATVDGGDGRADGRQAFFSKMSAERRGRLLGETPLPAAAAKEADVSRRRPGRSDSVSRFSHLPPPAVVVTAAKRICDRPECVRTCSAAAVRRHRRHRRPPPCCQSTTESG